MAFSDAQELRLGAGCNLRLVKALAAGLPILYNHVVKEVKYDQGGVKVSAGNSVIAGWSCNAPLFSSHLCLCAEAICQPPAAFTCCRLHVDHLL